MTSRPPIAAVRAVYGAGLLVLPRSTIDALSDGSRADESARLVTRLLGWRQLIEAAVLAGRPLGTLRVLGVAVDAVHCLTAIGVAVFDQRHRRLAAANAVTAAGFAVWGTMASGKSSSTRASVSSAASR